MFMTTVIQNQFHVFRTGTAFLCGERLDLSVLAGEPTIFEVQKDQESFCCVEIVVSNFAERSEADRRICSDGGNR